MEKKTKKMDKITINIITFVKLNEHEIRKSQI